MRARSPAVAQWGQELRTLQAFFVREYRIWQSYRMNQVMWLTNLFVTTLLFFLMGRMLGPVGARLRSAAYGRNYMSFIVVGVAVNVFLYTNLSDPYTRIARSYFNGIRDGPAPSPSTGWIFASRKVRWWVSSDPTERAKPHSSRYWRASSRRMREAGPS